MNGVLRAPCSVLSLVALVAASMDAQSTQRSTGVPEVGARLSYGITVSRDTVLVGDPFTVRFRVRAPKGATIRFPENPDTSRTVQARDPRVIQTSDSVQSLDQIASYQLAAWDIGRQPIVLSDAVVTWETPAGRALQRIPVINVNVFVRSVLPLDTALRVPMPARPLWETKAFPWWIVALIVAAILLALWWWYRRKRQMPRPIAPAIDPYDRAAADFARIEAMGLVDAGERTRFVALVIEVLRDYLAARYPDARLALTSRELVSTLRRRTAISGDALQRALHDADLAKFAGMALTEERARAVGRDARAIVEREHAAAQPQPDAQAAA